MHVLLWRECCYFPSCHLKVGTRPMSAPFHNMNQESQTQPFNSQTVLHIQDCNQPSKKPINVCYPQKKLGFRFFSDRRQAAVAAPTLFWWFSFNLRNSNRKKNNIQKHQVFFYSNDVSRFPYKFWVFCRRKKMSHSAGQFAKRIKKSHVTLLGTNMT